MSGEYAPRTVEQHARHLDMTDSVDAWLDGRGPEPDRESLVEWLVKRGHEREKRGKRKVTRIERAGIALALHLSGEAIGTNLIVDAIEAFISTYNNGGRSSR